MSSENLPAKRDNDKIARVILIGPLGNWIYEQITKTDYERQVEAIQKLRDGGMKHGHVKMTSTRGVKVPTEIGEVNCEQKHVGEYRW